MFARTEITSDDLYIAKKILAETPVYEYSHRQEQANEVGVLGEVLARRWLKTAGVNVIPTNTTQHDLRMSEGGKTIDVKTKDRTVTPRMDYEASVPLYNHDHQRPDYYLFVSLLRDKGNTSKDISRFTAGFIVGAISQNKLNKIGIRRDRDEVDPRNGTQFWTSCLNVYHRDLVTPQDASAVWRAMSPYIEGWT